jgi:hypothetical protein
MKPAVYLAIGISFLGASCRSSAAHERGRWQTTVSPASGMYVLTDTATGRVWQYVAPLGEAGHWEALPPVPGAAK